jgi:hypothetical protein
MLWAFTRGSSNRLNKTVEIAREGESPAVDGSFDDLPLHARRETQP